MEPPIVSEVALMLSPVRAYDLGADVCDRAEIDMLDQRMEG